MGCEKGKKDRVGRKRGELARGGWKKGKRCNGMVEGG